MREAFRERRFRKGVSGKAFQERRFRKGVSRNGVSRNGVSRNGVSGKAFCDLIALFHNAIISVVPWPCSSDG
jgi:hypothetical protein